MDILKMKIAFFSENMNFCKPVMRALEKKHEVSLFKFARQISVDRIASLIHWADLVYCEWADQLLMPVSFITPPDKKLVARIHRYEIYNDAVDTIKWDNVDLLVNNISSPHLLEKFKAKCDIMPKKMFNLPDGVDLNLWRFSERKFEKPYQITICGTIIPRKGVYELIRMFSELPKGDFELNIVGKRFPEYYENCTEIIDELQLGDSVKFWDYMEQEKLVKFFEKMHIIVSNSTDEGNHTVVKEAMATGLYPVVNAWKGARVTYPEKCIFRKQTEFLNIIKDWDERADKKLESAAAHTYIKANYDASVQSAKLVEEIEKLFSIEDQVSSEVKKEMEHADRKTNSDNN